MDAVAVIGLQLAQEAPTALRPVRKLFLGVASFFSVISDFQAKEAILFPKSFFLFLFPHVRPSPLSYHGIIWEI